MNKEINFSLLMMAFCVPIIFNGCAAVPPPPKTWYKEGTTQEQFRRDMIYCRQYGMQSAQSNGLSGNMFVEAWIQREANSCLTGLGYQ